ncbi:MAG: 16S rRNA (uracil(1498)-N(3))-methyltransferase [Bacteroidales bacterium]|nr:16S rRNA (uracil(1498)-N(3))-methyltransferase [Bacteroidales bacterium]
MDRSLFYRADITGTTFTLNTKESGHLVRVLRMKNGDMLRFTDGKGKIYTCKILDDNTKGCEIEVLDSEPGKDKRSFYLQIAVAPTKNINRFEWFLEKATEIGIDRIIPFVSGHSERKDIKTDRLDRVITAAMKQSLKSFHPKLDEIIKFSQLIELPFEGRKFIACLDDDDTPELSKVYQPGENAWILIGPEGDFSPKEIENAKTKGFMPVRLGPYRLRTETAAIAACHTINILNY